VCTLTSVFVMSKIKVLLIKYARKYRCLRLGESQWKVTILGQEILPLPAFDMFAVDQALAKKARTDEDTHAR
jgi:hypothetical protein